MQASTQSKTLLVPALAVCVACSQSAEKPADTQAWSLPRDVHSFAQPEKARVTNISLDLTPDFSTHQLRGTVRLAIERGQNPDSIVLDVRDLTIKSIKDAGGNALGYKVGATQKLLGAPLAIALPPQGDTIIIDYETSPGAAAVQWLTPQQTAGGKLPFMFTQGQAILTRTWVPTQDSPGIRQTYDATIHVPTGMVAVMSAERTGTEGERDPQGLALFRFRMDKRIPPYLLALAVGDIAFRPIGKNTGVYAEPAVVDKAASEFSEVDQMIAAAEKLYGPYRWGRYDILVLPPSFPFGGMENPRLTFATPTILAGDRSLVALVAHELAHSWAGNLVTNATWRDFWLNEGFTVYLERRIVERVFGVRRAEMEAVLGLQDLEKEMATLPEKDRVLHVDLAGRDPDEGFTDVPYEKGALFLRHLETVVGRERFDRFLRGYFDHFAFQSITTEDFLEYLRANLLAENPDIARQVPIEEWIEKPGLPASAPRPKSEALVAVQTAAAEWRDGKTRASALPTKEWTTQEWLHFLRALPPSLPAEKLAELDAAFRLTDAGNSEITNQWLLLAIASGYEPAHARLERFLTSMGRRKFLKPLYEELVKTPEGKARALAIYRKARPTYHPIAVTTVDKIVGWGA